MVALGLWGAAVLLVGGLLLAPHLAALPAPLATDLRLRAALTGPHGVLAPGGWGVVHVFYRTCTCSRRTIAHLLARRALAGVDEVVVIVDDDAAAAADDAALAGAGFRVVVITPAALRERFHIEAVPLLVIARPGGDLAYVGGYNRHKQSAAYEDLAILRELRATHSREPLPVFGCATSKRLAAAFDPLGLRR